MASDDRVRPADIHAEGYLAWEKNDLASSWGIEP